MQMGFGRLDPAADIHLHIDRPGPDDMDAGEMIALASKTLLFTRKQEVYQRNKDQNCCLLPIGKCPHKPISPVKAGKLVRKRSRNPKKFKTKGRKR